MSTDNRVPNQKAELTNGEAAAAIMAVGLTSGVFSVLSILSDLSPAAKAALGFYKPAGALSGVSTTAVAFWAVTWIVLGRRWREREVSFGKINTIAIGLFGLSLVILYPFF